MDNYFEQNVAGERGAKENLAYCGCWAACVVLALIALVSIMGIVGPDGVSWLNVILTLACAALAVVVYLAKDCVYREYDYILWNGEFEVCAVYNLKRRKKVASFQLDKVTAWGPASAMAGPMHGAQKRRWCVREDRAWCVVYALESGKVAALLELSPEMCDQLRGVSRAMRTAEVKP